MAKATKPFEDLISPIMVQEMFESYFENKPSIRIDEQINSFLNKNHSLTKLNAIKVFREFFNEKPHETICFLSALRRYLRIDNDNNLFNSKAKFLDILKLQDTTPPKALIGSQDSAN